MQRSRCAVPCMKDKISHRKRLCVPVELDDLRSGTRSGRVEDGLDGLRVVSGPTQAQRIFEISK